MKFLNHIAILCLSGCAMQPEIPAVPGVLEGVKTTVQIDARLFESCEDFSELTANPRPSDVLDQHARDVKVLNCLRSKNKALIKTLKQAFHITE